MSNRQPREACLVDDCPMNFGDGVTSVEAAGLLESGSIHTAMLTRAIPKPLDDHYRKSLQARSYFPPRTNFSSRCVKASSNDKNERILSITHAVACPDTATLSDKMTAFSLLVMRRRRTKAPLRKKHRTDMDKGAGMLCRCRRGRQRFVDG